MLLWSNSLLIHHPHGRLTGELLAVVQEQRRERHVLEGRDVTWWDGVKREGRRHISTAKKVPRSDQIQVLPWGNSLLIRPTCTVGLPVRFSL